MSNAAGEREYETVYQCETDSRQTTPIECRDHADIPNRDQHYVFYNSFDLGAFPVDYKVNYKDASLLVQLVTVLFSSRSMRRHQEDQDDPVDQDPIISGGGTDFRRVPTKDKDGNPIITSAGEPITDLQVDDSRATLFIQKNFNTIDPDQYAEFTNAVNTQTFFNRSARKWKLRKPRWQQRFRGDDTPFYTVTFEFDAAPTHGNNKTWDLDILDRGTYYVDNNGAKHRFQDAKGRDLRMGNLDGSGDKLADGIDPVHIVPAFRYYPEKDFADLNIPTSL